MPRSYGDTLVHTSHFDWAVRYDCPLPSIACPPPNGLEQEIGKIIAQRLIEDGATLQLGIGCIPDAVLCALLNHKDLGIHSEIICDAMVDLVQHGIINNKRKIKHRGRIVSSFAIGTKKLYDFLHRNPVIGNYDQLIYIDDFEKERFNVILQFITTSRYARDQLRKRSRSDLEAAEDDGHQFLYRDGPHWPGMLRQFRL